MKIRVTDKRSRNFKNPGPGYLIVLRRDSWDDFGYKTLFQAELHSLNSPVIYLGSVKILELKQRSGKTKFDSNSFSNIGENRCSLGQDVEYYEKLRELPEAVWRDYFSAMRDAAMNESIASKFEKEEGWRKFILRFGQAEHTLAEARTLFMGAAAIAGRASMVHQSKKLGARLEMEFDDSGPLPGRCKILIGFNGVGKTELLAEIARATSKVGQAPKLEKDRTSSAFSSVVAISYSAFDTFALPPVADAVSNFGQESSSGTTRFGYTYCGLRRIEKGRGLLQLKSVSELESEILEAHSLANSRNPAALQEAIAVVGLDPSFGRSGLDMRDLVTRQNLTIETIHRLSAGQKIVVNIVVQLVAHLRRRSLVLFDEPETHLHPSLLASTIRAVQGILFDFDSFAIIATHSPVILQELPTRDVLVIERAGSIVKAKQPQFETFGASLGELTKEAFGLDNSVSDYRQVLKKLAERMDIEQIEELFPLGLNGQARALALRAWASRDLS